LIHYKDIKEVNMDQDKLRRLERLYAMLFLDKSGSKKKEISNILEKVCKGMGKKFETPTSYHSEQLVEKVFVEPRRRIRTRT